MNVDWFKGKPMVLIIAGIAIMGMIAFGIKVNENNVRANIAEKSLADTNENAKSAEPLAAAIKMHVVGDGETLGTIAASYNIDVDTLLGANPELGENIHPGDQLTILPQKGVLHTVDMGDTLWGMANAYGIDVMVIITANGKNDEHLTIGEKLFVPGAKPISKAETLVARAEAQVSRGASNRFSWPAQGEFSSPFGYRWGRLHAGIDIANDVGTAIHAAMAGRVTYVGYYSGYGYTVMIEHSQGYETLYGHLSDFAVSNGQYVRAGQVIAYMGNSGYSTGPHLHFEVHKDGRALNPLNVLP